MEILLSWFLAHRSSTLTKPAVPAGDVINFTPTQGVSLAALTAGEAWIFLTLVDGYNLTR